LSENVENSGFAMKINYMKKHFFDTSSV